MKLGKWATGVALGAAGALAFTAPAAAENGTNGLHHNPPPTVPPTATVTIHDDCTDVLVTIDGNGTNRGWRVLVDGEVVLPEGAAVEDIPQSDPPWGLWIDPESMVKELKLEGASGAMVDVQWYRSSTSEWGAHEDVDTKVERTADKCEPPQSPAPTQPPATTPPSTGEDDGEGGEQPEEELPMTGSSTMLIAGGAIVLLAAGGVLFVLARRRRVSFTA